MDAKASTHLCAVAVCRLTNSTATSATAFRVHDRRERSVPGTMLPLERERHDDRPSAESGFQIDDNTVSRGTPWSRSTRKESSRSPMKAARTARL